MIVTNGTVSRTYKTADFEGRTVSLGFSLDPGEDYDACVAQIAAVVERRARSVPEFRDSSEKVEKKPARRPPTAATEPVMEPVMEPARRPPTAATEPVMEPVMEPAVVTDDAMLKACQKAGVRLHSSDAVRALVREYVDAAGKSVITIEQDKREQFLADLNALKVEETNV